LETWIIVAADVIVRALQYTENVAMDKKPSGAEIKRVMKDLIENGLYHIAAINNEIQSLKIEDPKSASVEDQNKLRALTLTLTLINDLIHPAHKLAYALAPEKKQLIDYCVTMQDMALKNKLIDECHCSACKSGKKIVN
jgi:hypothetical protein